MNNLQEAIRSLQMNNKLVVLRCCGGSGEGRLLSGLTQGYTALDLTLPNLRLQVEQNARLFIENLALPAYLANLHYAPSLLRALLAQRSAAGQNNSRLHAELLFAGGCGGDKRGTRGVSGSAAGTGRGTA